MRILALSAVVVLSIGLASTAWTRDDGEVETYQCRNGERFTVEYHPSHIRLRTGAGVFALRAGAGNSDYSDGQTVFRPTADGATLERPGLPPASDCVRPDKA